MRKALQPFRLFNATVILPDRLIPGGALDVESGRLTAVGRLDDLPRWSGATIDANGDFVSPGFVDLHVHGGDNADFMDGTIEAFETVCSWAARKWCCLDRYHKRERDRWGVRTGGKL